MQVKSILNYIYVDKNANIQNYGIEEYCFSNATIYLHGLLYVYEKKAGKESIEWLYEKFCSSKKIPYMHLRGTFTCILKTTDELIIFTDNSNMHCVYYSNDYVCSSFLRIIKLEIEHERKLTFNNQTLCEYYTLGNIFWGKTFFNEIRILDSFHLISIKNGKLSLESKNITGIDGPSEAQSIEDFFVKMSYSLSDLNVCQALTGGYDSRLVYVCTSKHISDHVAISANNRKHSDVKIAEKVAQVNGTKLEIISKEKPVFSDTLLDDIVVKADGIQPIDVDSDLRLSHFIESLSKEYDVQLTGDGGVLHKDWEWIQDFPFYRKKKSNAKQFYKQRIYYINNEKHLGKTLKRHFDLQQSLFIKQLNSISKNINTQSYDSWYYYVSGNRSIIYNNVVSNIIRYAPLLELDIVSFSYLLPRKERFFHNAMRKAITNENNVVARIRTNYGTTASSELPFVIRDCFMQSLEYFRKIIRYTSRKLLNKTLLNKSVLDWSLEEEIRNSQIIINAIGFVKNCGYLDDNVDINDLSYAEIQRIIHIYWLSNYVYNLKSN